MNNFNARSAAVSTSDYVVVLVDLESQPIIGLHYIREYLGEFAAFMWYLT